MDATQMVEDARILLEQMSESPDTVLTSLDQAEQSTVIAALAGLADRAAAVQTEAELLTVAEAMHRLVEDTPALRALLLPSEEEVAAARAQRTITLADHRATTNTNAHVHAHAAQIRNTMVECRQRLEQALREQTQQEHKNER